MMHCLVGVFPIIAVSRSPFVSVRLLVSLRCCTAPLSRLLSRKVPLISLLAFHAARCVCVVHLLLVLSRALVADRLFTFSVWTVCPKLSRVLSRFTRQLLSSCISYIFSLSVPIMIIS